MAPLQIRTLDDSLQWLARMEQASRPRSVGAWPLSAVLHHLAQSVEMSIDGYPQARSPLFQRTAGSMAFSVFKWHGRMSHSLSEPIPGAPGLLASADWRPAALHLRRAIVRFQAHQGPLRPHFAYGSLAKADFAQAHSLHIANHGEEILLD